MAERLPDFKARAAALHARLGAVGAARLLDGGSSWDLTGTLRRGGAIVFPHVGIDVCGHHVGAAVRACLDSGLQRVVAVGVLHALTSGLDEARARVAAGGDPAREPAWGVQGPGLGGRSDWEREFSLDGFVFLWSAELARRGIRGPELVLRYPFLAGGRPDLMPGIDELASISAGAALVATADSFHHGIGYGDPPGAAHPPDAAGLDAARRSIESGHALLERGDYRAFQEQCVRAKSDARDVGQVLRYLVGPMKARILDLVAADMSGAYRAPSPTWVAGALVTLDPAAGRPGSSEAAATRESGDGEGA